jgi:hypothetical protein
MVVMGSTSGGILFQSEAVHDDGIDQLVKANK